MGEWRDGGIFDGVPHGSGNSGYHIIKSYFWHRANFELKYLRPQMGYRKVMVCPRKLCSSRFQNTPYFYSYLNSKGLYYSLKSKILFLWTPCRTKLLDMKSFKVRYLLEEETI